MTTTKERMESLEKQVHRQRRWNIALGVMVFVGGLTVFLAGCATPVAYTTKPMTEYDQHTSYAVEDFNGGFTITMYYSRYQFIPESDVVDTAAQSQMLALAYEIAESRNREIRHINEQRIKKSMGRNGVSGITSWSGTVNAYYKDPSEKESTSLTPTSDP